MVIPKGYKQTEVGAIPEDWEVKDLHDAFSRLEAGVSVNSDDGASSDFFVLKTSAIRNGKVNMNEIKPVIRKDYGRLKCSLKQGAIIISRMNTPAMVGECGYSERDASSVFLPDRLWQALPSTNEFDFSWLNYLLNTNKYAMAIRATATGTSNSMKNISKERFLEIKIPKPPTHEQRKIAMYLADIDKAIEATEKLLAKKKAIKQGAMQELLTGKRRLPGFTGEWAKVPLSELCTLITKQTGFDYTAHIKPVLSKQKTNDSIPMIQTINFSGKEFSFDTDYYIPRKVANQFPNILLTEKCVLFSIVGASVGNIGLYPGGDAFCGGAIGITRFREADMADWVYYYMSSKEGQAQIQLVTKGGAQATVTIADIRKFMIPMPSDDEREQITEILSSLDDEITVLNQKLVKYRQVKQGMMQQLLTGKIRLV